MKKILIILVFALFAGSVYSQNMFKPVPKDLFSKTQTTGALKAVPATSEWLWRFNVTVIADEVVWRDKNTAVQSPLSGVGPGIGYRHYYQAPDGTPASDFGVNLVAMLGSDKNDLSIADFKPAITINAFNFVNLGVDYGIRSNSFGLLLGAQVSF